MKDNKEERTTKKTAPKGDRVQDMTTGDPKRLIFLFMLPVIGGNILQQLYTVVDAMIVGQGVGVEALAAVGSTDWVYWMFMWAAGGFGQGFSVIVATAFGEKDMPKLRRSVCLSIEMSIACGIGLAGLGLITAGPILRLLHTPENIYASARMYLSIMFIGVLVICIYNTFACILRALGDSRNPFLALIISTVINIGLDILFVLVWHWGVAGAAIASVIAQSMAGTWCFICYRRIRLLRAVREEWKPEKAMIRALWNKGFATAFQYSIIAIGGVVVQFGINSLGFVYVAGFTATNKVYGVLEATSLAMGNTMMVYTGQNYGARNKERIRRGTRISTLFGVIISVILGILMITFGKHILMLFIDSGSASAGEVLEVAYRYLFNMSLMLVVLYIINTYRYIVMGMNCMTMVVVSSTAEFLGRVVMTILTLTVIGAAGVYFIEITAWACSALTLFVAYFVIIHKLNFGGENYELRTA